MKRGGSKKKEKSLAPPKRSKMYSKKKRSSGKEVGQILPLVCCFSNFYFAGKPSRLKVSPKYTLWPFGVFYHTVLQ